MSPWLLLLPLIPAGGALVVWALPARPAADRVRRWARMALLLAGALATGAVPRLPAAPALARLVAQVTAGTPLPLRLDGLSGLFILLMSGTLALADLALWASPLRRFEAVATLLVVAAASAACLADDLTTLAWAWGALDLACIGLETMRMRESEAGDVVRHAWSRSAATVLLIVAALWMSATQGRTVMTLYALPAPVLPLLALAATLRLGVFPLPGSRTIRWDALVVSLVTGGYFWSRLASIAGRAFAFEAWLVPGAAVLLATGCLAAVAEEPRSALRYVALHGMAIMLLAPLLQRQAGAATTLMAALNVSLCLLLLAPEAQELALPRLGRWQRLPRALAVASLAGLPATLGFATRLLFLMLCQLHAAESLVWMTVVSYALVSVPLWRHRALVWGEGALTRDGTPDQPGPWGAWAGLLSGLAPALILLLVGLNPTWAGRWWRPPDDSLRLLTWSGILEVGGRTWRSAALLGVVAPNLVGYALAQGLGPWAAQGRVIAAITTLPRLEWLYLLLEDVYALLLRLWRRALGTLEESFALGWILMWSAAILFYLVEG
ncbi:MAG: hypothetical protein V1772_11720 [Chloroflexota bacterium]